MAGIVGPSQLRLVTLRTTGQTFVRGALSVLVVGLAVDLLYAGVAAGALADARRRRPAGSERDDDARLLQFHGIFSPLVMSAIDHLAATMGWEEYGVGELALLDDAPRDATAIARSAVCVRSRRARAARARHGP